MRSDTDTVTSASLRVGRAQETDRISRLWFVEAVRSLTNAGGNTTDSASLKPTSSSASTQTARRERVARSAGSDMAFIARSRQAVRPT